MQIRKLAGLSLIIIIILVAINIYISRHEDSKQSKNVVSQNNTSNNTDITTQNKTDNILTKSEDSHSDNPSSMDTESDTSTELHGISPKANSTRLKGGVLYQNNFSIDDWVVVDCSNRLILKCPHKLIKDKTTPSYSDNPRTVYLQGKCRDITVDTWSFCGF